MEKAKNLRPFLKQLNRDQMAVLARIINQKPEWENYHIGMLPFMHHGNVVAWLGAWNRQFGTRFTRRIQEVLKGEVPSGFDITLNDSKVYRRFGLHPERGVQIPGLSTYYQARERRPFERKEKGIHYKSPGVWGLVTKEQPVFDIKTHTITLTRVKANHWMVHCSGSALDHVLDWLRSNVS